MAVTCAGHGRSLSLLFVKLPRVDLREATRFVCTQLSDLWFYLLFAIPFASVFQRKILSQNCAKCSDQNVRIARQSMRLHVPVCLPKKPFMWQTRAAILKSQKAANLSHNLKS